MFISELLNFTSQVGKTVGQGTIRLGRKNIKSISAYSSKAIYYFPLVVSDQCTPEEVAMISKALEKQYSTFVVTCIGLIPFHRINSGDQASVDEYLSLFHQNIGIDAPVNFNTRPLFESVEQLNDFRSFEKAYEAGLVKDRQEYNMMVDSGQYTALNEMYTADQLDKYTRHLYDRRNGMGSFAEKTAISEASVDIELDSNPLNNPENNLTGNAQPGNYNAFDSKSIFTNQDMNKANEMIPTIAKVNVGFIVDDTNEVVSRDVLVGIKTFVHRIQSSELVTSFYQTIMNKRKFLKFVKFTTGEEKSLTDLVLGVGELKSDALESKAKKSSWLQAFKRRRRWSKMTIPFLMKSYTPNGTVVMTMNEVEYIKERYGIDLMRDGHIRMLMEANFLLGFVILDQSNEIAYISYDSHNYEPQEYSYNLLEREMNANDRVMRELYRTFSTR